MDNLSNELKEKTMDVDTCPIITKEKEKMDMEKPNPLLEDRNAVSSKCMNKINKLLNKEGTMLGFGSAITLLFGTFLFPVLFDYIGVQIVTEIERPVSFVSTLVGIGSFFFSMYLMKKDILESFCFKLFSIFLSVIVAAVPYQIAVGAVMMINEGLFRIGILQVVLSMAGVIILTAECVLSYIKRKNENALSESIL